jgi:hypothetical protein
MDMDVKEWLKLAVEKSQKCYRQAVRPRVKKAVIDVKKMKPKNQKYIKFGINHPANILKNPKTD